MAVWAAFAAGRHLVILSGWQQSVWRCRQLIEEGRLNVGEEVPAEMAELAEAVELLVDALDVSRARAVQLGRWVERWTAEAEAMLVELVPGRSAASTIDWTLPMPPGTKEFDATYQTIRAAFGRHPHLCGWFRLGERLAEESDWYGRIPGDLRAGLCRAMDAIGRMGRYPFLEPLVRVLAARRPEDAVPDDLRSHLVDPVLKVVRVSYLETYLRACLREGARPLPVITVRGDGVEFFGRSFRSDDFRNGEWRVLCYLCSNPRRELARADIIRHAGLRCSPRSLAAHVARLRTKLRPAVSTYFAGSSPPEYADDCFIVGRKKKLDGPYQLDVDPLCVRVDGPRSPGELSATGDGHVDRPAAIA